MDMSTIIAEAAETANEMSEHVSNLVRRDPTLAASYLEDIGLYVRDITNALADCDLDQAEKELAFFKDRTGVACLAAR